MDNLFRKTRLGFLGTDQETKEDIENTKDRRIPLQKTQSFKDKKKEPNWFRKQVTWKMSQDYESEKTDEHAMAVAAAAYAITSLAELRVSEHKRASKSSTVPIKSKKEDPSIPIPDRGKKISKITQISEDAKKPEKTLLHTPSFRKASSSLDKQLGESFKQSSGGGTSKQSSGPMMKTNVAVNPKPVPQLDNKRQNPTKSGMGKLQADIWEESEAAKITERYKSQTSTILSWEEKRKAKAKRQLDKSERELERKRTNRVAKYRRDIQSIEQVVKGAKAKAEEKKKNDELKLKEKANKIRKTGKVPSTCSCF